MRRTGPGGIVPGSRRSQKPWPRATSPIARARRRHSMAAPDAISIDTTGVSVDGVLDQVLAIVRARLAADAVP